MIHQRFIKSLEIIRLAKVRLNKVMVSLDVWFGFDYGFIML